MDDSKMAFIFLISRYLQSLPTEKVRLVFYFVQAFVHPEVYQRRRELLNTQQKQGFAESGRPCRNQSKSDENGGLPDILTVLLDKPQRP